MRGCPWSERPCGPAHGALDREPDHGVMFLELWKSGCGKLWLPASPSLCHQTPLYPLPCNGGGGCDHLLEAEGQHMQFYYKSTSAKSRVVGETIGKNVQLGETTVSLCCFHII